MTRIFAAVSFTALCAPLWAHEDPATDALSHALAHAMEPLTLTTAVVAIGLVGVAAVRRRNRRASVAR